MELEEVNDDVREISGRELLLSLGRFGAAIVADRFGLRGENSYYRDEDDNQEADFSDGLEDMEEERDVDAGVERPSPCSFLLPGRSFIGQQRLSSSRRQQEDWAVTATIYSCDLARGRVTGSMVAQNSPAAKRPIVTFFEGEIIDNINHTFITGCKWGTCPTPETDVRSWSRCPGFSRSLRNSVTNQHNGRVSQLGACSHVFMRWKECFFVDMPQDCPLTITGFYYLSLDRQTGIIGGYYHDPRSSPLQVLQLQPLELSGGAACTACSTDSGGARWTPDVETPAGRAAPAHLAPARAASGEQAGDAAAPMAPAGGTACEVPAGMAFGSYSFC